MVAGSGMLSGNMYLYCQNNPVCCVDPTGALGSFFDIPLSMADRMQMSQSMLDNYNAAKEQYIYSKKRTARRDSGLVGVSDEEVSRRARDKSLPTQETERYKTEEKVRGRRNEQKRQSQRHIEVEGGVDDNPNFLDNSPDYLDNNPNYLDNKIDNFDDDSYGLMPIIGPWDIPATEFVLS